MKKPIEMISLEPKTALEALEGLKLVVENVLASVEAVSAAIIAERRNGRISPYHRFRVEELKFRHEDLRQGVAEFFLKWLPNIDLRVLRDQAAMSDDPVKSGAATLMAACEAIGLFVAFIPEAGE